MRNRSSNTIAVGTQLYFQSTRPGGFGGQDLSVASRGKLKELDKGDHDALEQLP